MPAPAAARQSERNAGAWFSRPFAQQLLQDEQRQAIPLLTGCYGQHGFYLRCARAAPAELSGNLLQHVLRLHRDGATLDGDLRCDATRLPLQRESIELAYLLHALECGEDAHALLLELERVLAPEGQLMIVLLNPWSPWCLRWWNSGLRVRGRSYWRALLGDTGFEVAQQVGVGPVWPWGGPRAPRGAVSSDPWQTWRAGVLLHARKRRRALTPLRPRTVALEPGMGAG